MNFNQKARLLRRGNSVWSCLLALCMGGSSASAFGAAYSFSYLGAFQGNDVNNKGVVVGSKYTGQGSRAVEFKDDVLTYLDPAVSTWSVAKAINDSGVIVGSGISVSANPGSDWPQVATVWSSGTRTQLSGSPSGAWGISAAGNIAGWDMSRGQAVTWDAFGGTTVLNGLSWSSGMSNAGYVTGRATWGIGGFRAAGWHDGQTTLLPLLDGSSNSEGNAVNDNGKVVGYSFFAGAYGPSISRATLWQDGVGLDIGGAAGATSLASAVNNLGTVVGTYNGRAAIWNGSTPVDLNSLIDPTLLKAGWTLWEATAINDNGVIIGRAVRNTMEVGTFMLSASPVPEPANSGLLVLGLGGIAIFSRRKQTSVK